MLSQAMAQIPQVQIWPIERLIPIHAIHRLRG
jgi:hypothetical protein